MNEKLNFQIFVTIISWIKFKKIDLIFSSCYLFAVFYSQKPLGVTPDEAATQIVKTLNNKRKEVLIAPSLPKAAIYARSFLPNVLFAVMAAGVDHAAASEKMWSRPQENSSH